MGVPQVVLANKILSSLSAAAVVSYASLISTITITFICVGTILANIGMLVP